MKYECPRCGKQFRLGQNLARHLSTVHAGDDLLNNLSDLNSCIDQLNCTLRNVHKGQLIIQEEP